MTLKQQLQVYQEKLEAVTLRERVLVLLCGLAIVYLLAEFIWLGPQRMGLSQQHDELQQVTSVLSANQQTIAQLQQIKSVDQDAPKKRQIAHLTKQLDDLDEKLSELAVGLVRADQLPVMLENMVAGTAELKLIKLQTLPVSKLQMQQVEQSAAEADGGSLKEGESVGVYKHTTSIVVEGNYFQVLNYISALEALDWRFYWDSLDYQVTSYPKAQVEIQVYTLSTEEGLLGV